MPPAIGGYRGGMAGGTQSGGRGPSLAKGFARTQLSVEQVWIEYLALGGRASCPEIAAALHGRTAIDRHTHERLAAALNKFFADAGEDHPVEYERSG
jgi:hypothetical protein